MNEIELLDADNLLQGAGLPPDHLRRPVNTCRSNAGGQAPEQPQIFWGIPAQVLEEFCDAVAVDYSA